MKQLNYYKQNNLKTDDDIFNHLIETLRPGVTDWEYFVNWDKVFNNTREVESTLNTMNYLLGKEDFDSEFRYLAGEHPEIIKMIPILIVRNGGASSNYHVITANDSNIVELEFSFSKPNPIDEDISKAIEFIRKSGLISIFATEGVKNLVDYVLGVEAGLSSNGRKNRGGTSMENVCEQLLTGLGIDFIAQASADEIKRQYGFELTGMDGRRFDFAAKVNDQLFVFEVNCYSGGGSKLDKTASDYRNLQDSIAGQAIFIWLTDGHGWFTTKNPLRNTFDHNDYILNIEMVKRGALKEILGLA